MPETEAQESAEEIRQAVEFAGLSASQDQLHRWQQAGVIPSPTKRGLGRGSGSTVTYPSGTAAQTIALCQELKQDRSLKRAGWRVWWRGFPVSEDVVRLGFELQLKFAEAIRENAERFDDGNEIDEERDLIGLLHKFGRVRLSDKFLASARRRTGKFDFTTFLYILVRAFAGIQTQFTDSDAEIVAKGIGFGDANTIEEILPLVAATLDPTGLREAYEAASLEELAGARDDVRKAMSFLNLVRSAIDLLLPSRSPKSLLDVYDEPLNADLASITLIWLNMKSSPEAVEGFDSLLASFNDISAGNALVTEVFAYLSNPDE